MKEKFIFFAAALLCLVACNNKDNEPQAPVFEKGQLFTIGVSTGNSGSHASGRTMNGIDAGATLNYTWEAGDQILVTIGTGADADTAHFTLTEGAGTAEATFAGKLPKGAKIGDAFTVQYPIEIPDLSQQEYNGTTLPKNKMLFTGGGKLSANTAAVTLAAQYMVLQLNLYTRAETYDYNNPLTPLDSIVVDYTYKLYTNCRNKLTFSSPIEMPTTAAEAMPFYIVVPVENVASLNVTCFAFIKDETRICQLSVTDTNPIAAGTCLNMPAYQISWSSCLAAGTRITMADGSTKKVEDIVEGDLIRTFDHEAGCISSAKVCLAMQEEGQMRPLSLHFASGNTLTIAGQHGLIEQNSRKYVLIHSGNVQKYVGKCFYNANSATWDQLQSYEIGSTPVDRYAIYSAKHMNVIAENMLTVEDDVDFLLNIYELDANLKADAAQLQADIAQYGLCDVAKDFPEFAQYKEQMEALGGQYVYIAIGKGLVPANYIEQMKSYWLGR